MTDLLSEAMEVNRKEPTDPRSALAGAMFDAATEALGDAADVQRILAERGVLLVTEERLAAALAVTIDSWDCADKTDDELAAAIFAALSAEVTA